MTLHRNLLLPEANALFDSLIAAPELKGLTLIGGTALALQLGHRISLDFDFAQFGGDLPGFQIDQLMRRLKDDGHRVQMITDSAAITQFRINSGKNLLDLARDYVIDGVKVTFFVHGKNERQRAFYRKAEKLRLGDGGFDLLAVEGLKFAKSLVLADRVRSRDLYDLYILMRDHAYTMARFFATVSEYADIDDPEYYKAILRGEHPLDEDDEGLEAVDLEDGYKSMYDYFAERLDEYEIGLARIFFTK